MEFIERASERAKLFQLALAHIVQHLATPITVNPSSGDFYVDFCKGLEPIVYEFLVRMIEIVYQEEG